MTYSVYQHWDPLRVCVVGRSYPPEFYSWIQVPHVRALFEKIAQETEEDYQALVNKLESFGVTVLRPDLDIDRIILPPTGKWPSPPMTPRDYTVMIGEDFYESYTEPANFKQYYETIRDSSWPDCSTREEFDQLPSHIKAECLAHGFDPRVAFQHIIPGVYDKIYQHIKAQGNSINHVNEQSMINGAMVARIGQDLFFGTDRYIQSQDEFAANQQLINSRFPTTRNHIVNTGGHADGTYCPVCPGLIISRNEPIDYTDTFPGWEVIYLTNQSWDAMPEFRKIKNQNGGRWWIPGFEKDSAVVETVETWLDHWVGYIAESVFDVNMLIVDPKNVIVSNYNQQVFDAFDRYGITAHIVPFRHRYFWDGGIHCITSDLDREGQQQDFFKDHHEL